MQRCATLESVEYARYHPVSFVHDPLTITRRSEEKRRLATEAGAALQQEHQQEPTDPHVNLKYYPPKYRYPRDGIIHVRFLGPSFRDEGEAAVFQTAKGVLGARQTLALGPTDLNSNLQLVPRPLGQPAADREVDPYADGRSRIIRSNPGGNVQPAPIVESFELHHLLQMQAAAIANAKAAQKFIDEGGEKAKNGESLKLVPCDLGTDGELNQPTGALAFFVPTAFLGDRTAAAGTRMWRRLSVVAAIVVAWLFVKVSGYWELDGGGYGIADDRLANEILDVKLFADHVSSCGRTLSRVGNCARGVLHVPHPRDLDETWLVGENETHYFKGVDLVWDLECAAAKKGDLTSSAAARTKCFRGVHDRAVDDAVVSDLIKFSEELVHVHELNNSHIHEDVKPLLLRQGKGAIASIRAILSDRYGLDGSRLRPIAFRIDSALPHSAVERSLIKSMLMHITDGMSMQGIDALIGGQIDNLLSPLQRAVNFTASERRSKLVQAAYGSVEPCAPVSDDRLGLRSAAVLHTALHLTSSGVDHVGGRAVFLDEERTSPRENLKKGMLVDATKGRLVVNSAGRENLRCKLPVLSGIKLTLQIWWGEGEQKQGGFCGANDEHCAAIIEAASIEAAEDDAVLAHFVAQGRKTGVVNIDDDDEF